MAREETATPVGEQKGSGVKSPIYCGGEKDQGGWCKFHNTTLPKERNKEHKNQKKTITTLSEADEQQSVYEVVDGKTDKGREKILGVPCRARGVY